MDALARYQDVFDWEITKGTAKQRMAAAAVVAQMLHFLTIGMQYANVERNDSDRPPLTWRA